MPTLCAVH
jgi:predicted NAD/FAD-dependent oxidoreductase